MGNWVFQSGKCKGRTFSEVMDIGDLSWIQWLLATGDLNFQKAKEHVTYCCRLEKIKTRWAVLRWRPGGGSESGACAESGRLPCRYWTAGRGCRHFRPGCARNRFLYTSDVACQRTG